MIAGATRIAASAAVLSVIGIGVLSTVAVVAGTRHVLGQKARDWRLGWMLLAIAMLAFAGASVVRAAAGADTAPSATAQRLTVLATLIAIGGLTVLVRQRTAGRALESLLEGLIIGGASAFVLWTLAGLGHGVKVPGILIVSLSLEVVALWLAARLLATGPDRPAALKFVLAGWAASFGVGLLRYSGLLFEWHVSGQKVAALSLWVFGLWAAAALHPSLRRPLDAASVRDSRDVSARAALMGTAVLVVPVAVGAQLLSGAELHLGTVVAGATLLPLAVVLLMSYQLLERARAEYRAQHDALTGLPNRTLFQDRLNSAIAHSERAGDALAVMFLDLDRFKTVNDSLGHAAGNQLLQQVARRIRACLREQDTLARLGGDEFVVLVAGVRDEDARSVAQKVLDSFAEPFMLSGRAVFTSTSIGIATYPTSGRDAEALLKHADTAMYQAKGRGRNGYEFYSSDMSARASIRLGLESSLHTAIENGQLSLHYQPQVAIGTGQLVGFEALVRWRHPRLGYISPYAFIPLAEESGLIEPLGEWVIEAACRQVAAWLREGLPVVPVAVNVSARQLRSRSIEDVIERVLSASRVPGHLLEVELTETVLVDDVSRVGDFLDRLQRLGVRRSIDDFGTGYSGLSYLASMPIDALKIDQSFVQQIRSTAGDEHGIVGAIIALAGNLGLEVVAEGVESLGQARALLALGCPRMQGYLVSPPVPAERVPELLRIGTLFHWPSDDEAFVGTHVRSATTSSASGVTPLLAHPRTAALLQAVCRAESFSALDPEVLSAVLAALLPPGGSKNPLTRPLSARVATGTFAGLIPLSGTLAAANALPAPVQVAYSSFLEGFGIPVPAGPDAPAGGGHGFGAEQTVAQASGAEGLLSSGEHSPASTSFHVPRPRPSQLPGASPTAGPAHGTAAPPPGPGAAGVAGKPSSAPTPVAPSGPAGTGGGGNRDGGSGANGGGGTGAGGGGSTPPPAGGSAGSSGNGGGAGAGAGGGGVPSGSGGGVPSGSGGGTGATGGGNPNGGGAGAGNGGGVANGAGNGNANGAGNGNGNANGAGNGNGNANGAGNGNANGAGNGNASGAGNGNGNAKGGGGAATGASGNGGGAANGAGAASGSPANGGGNGAGHSGAAPGNSSAANGTPQAAPNAGGHGGNAPAVGATPTPKG